MQIRIPYFYNKYTPDKSYFMAHDLNVGATICRRLGLKVDSIILGKKEWKEIQGWAFGGGSMRKFTQTENQPIDIFDLTATLNNEKETELVLICHELTKEEMEAENSEFVKKYINR
jgi:hypothetical protein